MSRGISLLVWTGFSAVALMAARPLACADDSAPTPPPGYKTIYEDVGGKKMPLFVKQQPDPLSHANLAPDPLDHQKVYSETSRLANKTFFSGTTSGWDKSAEMKNAYVTKPYSFDQPANSNFAGKTTFPTAAFNGGRAAAGYDKSFATGTADAGQDESASAFAAIGSDEQNRTAPIEARSIDKFPAPMANKTFIPDQPANVKHNLGEFGNGDPLTASELPSRPLTIDEVRQLINHGFKPDASQPPPPASKPLNDPNYQPEPLRIEPTESETPAPRNVKDDDDKDDPVPSPGTLAAPPENSQPLPKP